MAVRQPRPVIGINADLAPAGKITPQAHRLNLGYADTVYAAGGLPIILPTMTSLRKTSNMLFRTSRSVFAIEAAAARRFSAGLPMTG